jgi:ribosomal protein L29
VKLTERERLHGLTMEQLTSELLEAERGLLTFRFDAGLNRLTNTAGLHNVRKRIAVLKTLMRQQELLAAAGVASMDEYKAFKVTERKSYRKSKVR